MVNKFSLSTITAFHSLLVIVAALLLCFPISAHAGADSPPSEPPPAPEASPPPTEPQAMSSFGTPIDILNDGFLTTTFLYDPQASESKFVMRLSKFSTISGCAQLQRGEGPLGEDNPNINETTKKYVSDRLEIMLDMPDLALKDSEPRYTNHDCDMGHLEAYANVLIDRDALIKRNIKKIAVKTPDIDFGVKDIEISKERLTLKSKNEGMRETWLTLWFFPKDSIKLYVPGASSNMSVLKEIRDFGLAHGLVPMDEVLEGYTLPHQANDYVYFVDAKRVFLRELNKEENNKQLGEIGISRTYHGPKGPQERIKPLPIFGSLVLEQTIR